MLKVDFNFFEQETVTLVSNYKFWKNHLGDEMWMNYCYNRSVGLAFLQGNFGVNIFRSKMQVFGRWIALVVDLMDCVFCVEEYIWYEKQGKFMSRIQRGYFLKVFFPQFYRELFIYLFIYFYREINPINQKECRM